MKYSDETVQKIIELRASGQAITWRCHKDVMPQYLKYLYDNANVYLNRKYEKYKTLTAV